MTRSEWERSMLQELLATKRVEQEKLDRLKKFTNWEKANRYGDDRLILDWAIERIERLTKALEEIAETAIPQENERVIELLPRWRQVVLTARNALLPHKRNPS
jgi:hypothetical protein